MKFLHYDLNLQPGDAVEVTLNKQANVRLLDSINYGRYRRGQKYTYYGGCATISPYRLSAPRPGHWHLVIDLGGYPGSVRASVRALSCSLV